MAGKQLDDNLFGTAAVELKLMTGAQVGECLMLQDGKPLVQVCLEHGYLRRDEVDQVLQHQRGLERRLKTEAHLFGRVAMSLKLLDRDQLRECLAQQRASGFLERLGETCIKLGYLDRAGVERILKRQAEVKQSIAAEVPRFGKVALEMGLLTRAQLDQCVADQRQEGSMRRIGEICVERGFLESSQVKQVLQRQADARHAQSPQQPAPSAPKKPPRAERSKTREPVEREGSSEPVERVRSVTGGAPMVDKYLRFMIEQGASDLHISSDCRPRIRIDGAIKAFGRDPLTAPEVEELLMAIVNPKALKDYQDTNDADFGYHIEGVARFRVNFFKDRKGMGAVFRQIPIDILDANEIGLPQKVIELCWLTKGLVLVTGPTGSGKSTTLAAMIDFINDNRKDHILTIEDPIEFVHPNKKCLVNQREIGDHSMSFKSALRAALREDPDVVLVGEMRDLETVAIAIETAETGHLVFGTLHTSSAASTVDRIIDQFPHGEQAQIRTMLGESLRGVIAQVLCKKIGGGRVPAFEFLMSTPAVANIIREGRTEQLPSVMQTGRKFGMQTMNEHLLQLVKDGLVEPMEAYMKSNAKRVLKQAFDEAHIPLALEGTGES